MPLGGGFAQGFLQTLQQGQQQALENARAQQELEQRKELQKLQAAILKGQEARMQIDALREQEGQAKRRRLLELLTTQGAEHPETKSAALALSLSEGKDPFATLQGLGDQRLFEQFLQQREAPQGGTAAPPAPAPAPQPAPAVAPQSSSVQTGPLHQQIVAEAQRQGVPPALALSVAAIESNFTPGAIGDNGRSQGIFQLQPPAALEVGVDPARRLDPAENIRGGVAYLKKKLAQAGGDPIQAGVLYNGGGDPQYAAKLQRAYAQYGGQGSQEPAAARPAAPQPDPAYQALDAQQRQALQDVQQLTALQVRLAPGTPTAQKVEKLIDNARQLANSLDAKKKDTPYARALALQQQVQEAQELQPLKEQTARAGRALAPIPRETAQTISNYVLIDKNIDKVLAGIQEAANLPPNILELLNQRAPALLQALEDDTSNVTGMFNGLITQVRAAAGKDPKVNRFLSALATIRDIILHERSGASVTGNELTRSTGALFGSLPNITQTLPLFLENLNNIRELVDTNLLIQGSAVQPLAGGTAVFSQLPKRVQARITLQANPPPPGLRVRGIEE